MEQDTCQHPDQYDRIMELESIIGSLRADNSRLKFNLASKTKLLRQVAELRDAACQEAADWRAAAG